MRLIDADATIDRYYAEWEYHCIKTEKDDRQWLRQCIDQAPTIDAEPVKHGHWLDGRCTNCAEEALEYVDDMGYLRVYTPSFCPNCGAKMDGGKDA